MITDYDWPRGAAGAAATETDRQYRKRDPASQTGTDLPKPQQGEGLTPMVQQQQGDPPASTTQQEGSSGLDPGLRTLYG